MQTIQVGLIGLGNVGREWCRSSSNRLSLIAERLGARLELKRGGHAASRRRSARCSCRRGRKLTDDAMEVLHDPEIAIVVELVGGYEPARTYLAHGPAAGQARGHGQ